MDDRERTVGHVFEWHRAKAKANLQKHEISFEEAMSVFADPLSVTLADPDHSADESRFIDIGLSTRGEVLVVVYTERESTIRIISARRATRLERRVYEDEP